MHLHSETIAQIVEDKNGHLLVGLKGNRSRLLNEIIEHFKRRNPEQKAHDRDVYCGHGRIETRIVDVIPFQTAEKYPYLSTAVRVNRTRIQLLFYDPNIRLDFAKTF